MKVVLGLDVGKSNLRVGVFGLDLRLLERWSVPTIDVPLARVEMEKKLDDLRCIYDIEAIGISIFGPLQTDSKQKDYGALIESSEAVWSDVNIPRQVASVGGADVYFDYDVNAGALAEVLRGAAKGESNVVYLSVGTGVGGVVVRGRPRPGFAPQLGHMYLPREADDLDFPGSCRFHGACLQGLASGRALALRWGLSGAEMQADHPAWDLEARYLARACANLVYTFSPEMIVVGSTVGATPHLVDRANFYLMPLLNNFLEPELRRMYRARPAIVQAVLAPDSSLIGAAALAKEKAGLRFAAR